MLVVVAITLLSIGSFFSNIFGNNSQFVENSFLRLKENVKELSTVKLYYTNVGLLKDVKSLWNIEIPFTSKRIISSYDGVIHVGVKLDKLKMSVEGNVINITMPDAEMLSHEIDENSVIFYSEDWSIFNPLLPSDQNDLMAKRKAESEEKFLKEEILLEAKKEAKNVLKQLILFSPEIESSYEIRFVE